LIASFFILFSLGTAQAGPVITAYGQTICILGGGNGTNFDWELRPEGGGTPFCSGTGNSTGTQAQFVTDFVAEIDGCASDISAYPSSTLGFTCPGGETGFTIARGPDSVNWELAIEDATNPPNLKVPTFSNLVSTNPDCRPPMGNDKPIPCNGNNPCCDGGSPPCTPVPEPGTVASLLTGACLLFGMEKLRKR